MRTPVGRAAQLNSGRVLNSCLHWSQKGAALPFLFFSYIFASVAEWAGTEHMSKQNFCGPNPLIRLSCTDGI